MQSRTRQAATQITYDSISSVPFISSEGNPWNQLQLYNLYRLILAGALLLITLTDNIVTQAHGIDVELLNAIVGFYTFIVIFGNIACYVEWPEYNKQVYLHTITDITALLLIIHASGGVSFGLGILVCLEMRNIWLLAGC